MIVDIVSHQQLPEVFSTNRNHHCSHKRNSTTINTISSSNTMTNGHRVRTDELGKKADQILGRAPAVVDYYRQPSIDFTIQHPPRLNILVSKSRVNNQQVSPVLNSNQSIIKNRNSVTVEQLVPLIFKVVASPILTKLPERISKYSKPIDNVIESHEMVHHETNINLSDDENEEIDVENPSKIQHSDSDMENDDEINRTNPNTLSLMDFLPIKHSPIGSRKRSLSPSTPTKQMKRKEELIKSFSSSVNIPIDIKQPTLPITIPTYLFHDQSIKTEDDQIKTSKRYTNSSIKHETNTDIIDNGTQQKKSKTSHVYKQEPTTILMNIKEEPNVVFSNEISSTDNMATVAPMMVQPKKEKPTANVKPLLQSTLMDNLLSTNNNPNVVNPPDRLTTATNTSTSANYANLKNMSIKELNSLAREKKKQADGEKRTFEDVKQSMSLYLESVCYFIQCASDEPILAQRTTLLTATLSMLQHLAYNYSKMFHISTNQSTELLNHIRPKFLLINYWLQSFIYHLQLNTNMPTIERYANQVTEYFNQLKNPSSAASLTRMNNQQQQQQLTPINDNNPISPLSTTSQTSSSDLSTTSGNNQIEQHRYIYDFSKLMLNSYNSTYYWNKAGSLMREKPLKEFIEQLLKQNQNRYLSRDDTTLDFILYIFDSIELLRLSVA